MKHLSLILVVVFFALPSCKTSRPTKNNGLKDVGNKSMTAPEQNKITDSLAYVKGIVAAKEKYINKEFGTFLKDLTIPVRSYTSNVTNRLTSSGIMISFDDWATTRNKSEAVKGSKDPVWIFIEWEKPLLRTTVESQLKRSAGEWQAAEQEFYSKLKVKDIK